MSFAARTSLPPSAAAIATWARIHPSPSASLVVACGGLLTAYSIEAPSSDVRVDLEGQLNDAIPAPQLRATFSTSIPCTVRSMHHIILRGAAAVAAAGRGADRVDALLLTFDEGKVSIVAFDPLSAALRTLAMVNFEHDAIGPGACRARAVRRATVQAGLAGKGKARLDPLGRAVALLVYDDQVWGLSTRAAALESLSEACPVLIRSQLAVLPLSGLGGAAIFEPSGAVGAEALDATTTLSFEEAEAEAADRRLASAVLGGSPYIIDLAEVREATAHLAGGAPSFATVADAAFLHGYGYAPALAVLERRVLTSASRLGSAAHTSLLTVLALDAAEQRATFVWGRDALPHDCFALVPAPTPVGEYEYAVR